MSSSSSSSSLASLSETGAKMTTNVSREPHIAGLAQVWASCEITTGSDVGSGDPLSFVAG